MYVGEYLIHLDCRKCPDGRRMNVAHGTNVKEKRGCSFIVSCFKDQNSVVIAKCPVDIGDFAPPFFGRDFQRRCAFGGFVDPLDALLREPDVGNKCSHRTYFLQTRHRLVTRY